MNCIKTRIISLLSTYKIIYYYEKLKKKKSCQFNILEVKCANFERYVGNYAGILFS